jgi:Uma2 family endonuclease
MQTRIPSPEFYRVETSFPIPLSGCAHSKSFTAHTGNTYAPGTLHQSIVLKMASALFHHVKSKNLGHVLHAPSEVLLSRETIFRPEILFVRKNRGGIIGQKHLYGIPDLVIEVLPHIPQESDYQAKKRLCSLHGVQEFWVVDFEDKKVETLLWSELGYVSGGSYTKSDRLSSPLLPKLNLPLSRIFGGQL